MTEPAPPVSRVELRTTDPDLAHEALRETYADFTVDVFGNAEDFAFRQTGMVASGVAFAELRYSMGVRSTVEANPDLFMVATRRSGPIDFVSGRDVVRPEIGQPVLTTLQDADWSCVMEDLTIETVAVDPVVLARAATAVFGIGPDELSFTSMTPVSSSAARYWHAVTTHVRQDVLSHAEIAGSPLVLAEALGSVATAALVTFPNTGLTRWDRSGSPGRVEPAALRRALAHVDEHAGEDIGVEEIAAAARVSVRGLQLLFRRHRDSTPMEHLRLVRLDRAHVDLQAADPTRGDTVAAIAARWGFTHPGRFAVQYRQVYGRTPGETLRR